MKSATVITTKFTSGTCCGLTAPYLLENRLSYSLQRPPGLPGRQRSGVHTIRYLRVLTHMIETGRLLRSILGRVICDCGASTSSPSRRDHGAPGRLFSDMEGAPRKPCLVGKGRVV